MATEKAKNRAAITTLLQSGGIDDAFKAAKKTFGLSLDLSDIHSHIIVAMRKYQTSTNQLTDEFLLAHCNDEDELKAVVKAGTTRSGVGYMDHKGIRWAVDPPAKDAGTLSKYAAFALACSYVDSEGSSVDSLNAMFKKGHGLVLVGWWLAKAYKDGSAVSDITRAYLDRDGTTKTVESKTRAQLLGYSVVDVMTRVTKAETTVGDILQAANMATGGLADVGRGAVPLRDPAIYGYLTLDQVAGHLLHRWMCALRNSPTAGKATYFLAATAITDANAKLVLVGLLQPRPKAVAAVTSGTPKKAAAAAGTMAAGTSVARA